MDPRSTMETGDQWWASLSFSDAPLPAPSFLPRPWSPDPPALPYRVLGWGPLQVLHGACVAHEWPLVHVPGTPICWRPEVDVLLTVTGQQAPWARQLGLLTSSHSAGCGSPDPVPTHPHDSPGTRGDQSRAKPSPMWPEKVKMGFTRVCSSRRKVARAWGSSTTCRSRRSANTSTWPFSDHTPATGSSPSHDTCRVGRRGGEVSRTGGAV